LGNAMSQGGFIIHRLVGCACEADACIQLSRLAPTLGAKEARWLIAELERIDRWPLVALLGQPGQERHRHRALSAF
jgi:hypothetical protein